MTDPPVIDLSKGRQRNHDQFSLIEFPCPACKQEVKGNRGYYVEHMVIVISPYGIPEEHFCPASNNKIQAELRTLKMHGECENCGIEMDLELTEEYPGGLKQEGGWLETTCVACNGLTVAVCDHCGGELHRNEEHGSDRVLIGCISKTVDTPEWVHGDDKAECPNQVLAEETEDDTEDEELDSEFFDAAPKELVKASPMQGTIRTNPKHTVIVRDGFTITLPEDDTPHQDQEV